MGRMEDVAPHWSVNFWVPDAEVVASKAAELGGRVVVPPTTRRASGQSSWLTRRRGAHRGTAECRILSVGTRDPRQRVLVESC